jgi:hypothetical protein
MKKNLERQQADFIGSGLFGLAWTLKDSQVFYSAMDDLIRPHQARGSADRPFGKKPNRLYERCWLYLTRLRRAYWMAEYRLKNVGGTK